MNKLFGIIITSVFLAFMQNNFVYAAEKSLDVTLEKEYEKASFSLEYEVDGEYDATLTAPNGDVYEFIQYDENSANVVVGSLKAGKYSVNVSKKEGGDDADGAAEESSAIDIDKKSDIGKVTITVKALNDDTVVSSAIKVAKEIAGLKIYFKDDDVVVNWTDETVGNVHVTITDTQTQEIIGNQTVSDKEYEVAIPEETKEITVTVVPSESEKVSEAGEQYTLLVNNHPDATVEFVESVITSHEFVTTNISLGDKYSLMFLVNGNRALANENELPVGSYTYEIPVSEGDNDIKVYVIDENGNMRSTSLSIKRDTVAPKLTIDSDINGISTYENSVVISGQVNEYSVFTINDEAVEPDWEGNFTKEIALTEGSNHIFVSAIDEAGNEASFDAIVTMLVKEDPGITPQMIVFILIILAGIGFLVFRYIKSHYQIVYDEVDDEDDGANVDIESTSRENGILSLVKGKGLNTILSLGTGIVAVIFLLRVILLLGVVGSGSMEPTLMTGDFVISNRLAYLRNEPQRGDIISFYHADEDTGVVSVYEKRIIGVAGDEISFADGYVFINGKRAVEEYLDEDIETNCSKTFTVPDGTVFVLGDKRETSIDSRYWDNPYVNISDIIAKFMVNLGQ